MAKWADYLISGIWFSDTPHKHVSHVMLHTDSDTDITRGTKHTKNEVIALIKKKQTVRTMTWNYTSGGWRGGALVGYESLASGEYLRTHKDATVTDNIDNLINMDWFQR